jgi:hypothetical protein
MENPLQFKIICLYPGHKNDWLLKYHKMFRNVGMRLIGKTISTDKNATALDSPAFVE